MVVEGAEEYPILVRAEVQHPKVCLLSCEATISNCFVGVPAKTEVTLMNMTMCCPSGLLGANWRVSDDGNFFHECFYALTQFDGMI